MGRAVGRTAAWLASAVLASMLALGGCEAVLGVGDLSERSGSGSRQSDGSAAGMASGNGAAGSGTGSSTGSTTGAASGSGASTGVASGSGASSGATSGSGASGSAVCTNTATDSKNCGACGFDCSKLPHVSGPVTCNGGLCSVPASSCADGWAHCTGSAHSGCETDVTQPSDCASCGVTCPSTTPKCVGSGKTYSCVSGCPVPAQSVCGMSCVDLTADISHCGNCTTACSAMQICKSSACQSCPMGQVICSGSCSDTDTDSRNCGGCGNLCAGTCTGGRCLLPLASGQTSPYGLAIDSNNVYWVNDGVDGQGSAAQLPKGGGTPTVLATGLNDPRYIAVAGNRVYWTNFGTGGGNYMDGAIFSVPVGGGSKTVIASGQPGASGLAIDASRVYVADYDGSGVVFAPLVGSTATLFAAGPANDVTLDATNVYFTGYGHVVKVAKASGMATTLATVTPVGVYGVVVDATFVYWTVQEDMAGVGNGSVMKVPIAGGSTTTLASGNLGAGRYIAIDGSYVYWTNSSQGSVMKVPLGGGTVTTLVTGQAVPSGIAVDATSVYWANYGNGTVVRLTPK